MRLSLLRPALLQRSLLRTAAVIPARIHPIRAFSIYSPRLEAAAPKTKTKAKTTSADGKPKAKKTAKPKAKPKPKAKAKPKPKPKVKKVKEEKKKKREPLEPPLTLPPKGFATSYTIFFTDFFKAHGHEYTDESGKIVAKNVAQAAGKAWKETSPEEKERYTKESNVAKAAYDKNYAEWFNSYTEQQRNEIEKYLNFGRREGAKTRLRYPGTKIQWRKEVRERPGNPGKPSSPFFEYLKSRRQEYTAEAKAEGLSGINVEMQATARASSDWNKMSEEDKEPWKKMQKERRIQWTEWAVKEGLISPPVAKESKKTED